jgi:hypothetical protein
MPSLKDSWLRIERARSLRYEIYSHFGEYLDGDEIILPLRSVANYELGIVDIVIDSSPQEMPNLGILIGDILHSYRASLDYLWWQFACRRLGRDPTDKEAKSIQFPVINDSALWSSSHSLFKYVNMDDVECLKCFQPFSLDGDGGDFILLNLFVALSNRDKHRAINVYIFRLLDVMYKNNSGRVMGVIPMDTSGPLGIGSVVGRVQIDLNGLNLPDAIETTFRAYVAESTSKVNILSFLEGVDSQCEKMLMRSAKFF